MQHHLVTRLLLASYQRPADWSHVSARLSVNKRSPLPSPSLGLFTLSPSSASCLPHLALRLSVLLIPVLLWNQVLLLCFLICLIFTLSLHCLRRCHCSFWEFLLSYPLFLSFLLPALCWDPAAIMMMRDSVLPGSREWGEANADKPCIITPKEMTLTSLTLKIKLQVNTTNFTLRVL